MNATAQADAAEKPINMLTAVQRALHDALEEDPKVLVFGEDVGDPEDGGVIGVSKGLSTKFGNDRVRSTPIAEQAIIGAAIGAALGGYRPVAEIMLMNFTTVAMDMIVNHAAKLRFMSGGQTHVPMVIRTMTGTGFRSGGQHSDYLEAWFAHTAGLKVVIPSNSEDAYGLMRTCIEDNDPCIFIENGPSMRGAISAPPKKGLRIPLGKAKTMREGKDVTIITYSRQVKDALAAAEALAKDGASVEVIDLRSIQPWDKEAVLNSVGRTKRAVIVHEAVRPFGVGAEIAATIQEELFSELKGPVRRLGAPFCPVPFAKPLEVAFAPSATQIEQSVRGLLDYTKGR
jgi:acetoin:2,6-dichlorophenolindophenol oxidoreductase subunit beta